MDRTTTTTTTSTGSGSKSLERVAVFTTPTKKKKLDTTMVEASVDIDDFDLPGQVGTLYIASIERAVQELANQAKVPEDTLIDRFCLFFALHGTSSVLNPSIGFKIGDNYIPIGEVISVLRSAAPQFTLRQIMRYYADRTRSVLTRNLAFVPIFCVKYNYPDRTTGYDFADGCKNPPLDQHKSLLLNRCRLASLSINEVNLQGEQNNSTISNKFLTPS